MIALEPAVSGGVSRPVQRYGILFCALQCFGIEKTQTHAEISEITYQNRIAATHSNVQQHTTTHCHTLQHTATYYNTIQQHPTTHCNTLQHTATPYTGVAVCTATPYNTLQHPITHCNVLQHNTATPYNTLQRTTTQSLSKSNAGAVGARLCASSLSLSLCLLPSLSHSLTLSTYMEPTARIGHPRHSHSLSFSLSHSLSRARARARSSSRCHSRAPPLLLSLSRSLPLSLWLFLSQSLARSLSLPFSFPSSLSLSLSSSRISFPSKCEANENRITLQHTATPYNTLQRTTTHCVVRC